MFGLDLTLFTIFGIRVKVDIGWAVIAILIAWTLAQGVFPQIYDGLPAESYWWMAIVAVFGLAMSIVLHELSHSLVAKAFGVPIETITLFMFGGVAELQDEPGSPPAELFMAIAGPLASLALGFVFHLGEGAMSASEGAAALAAVLGYLSLLNTLLAGFNMIPAFPLDGGRVLRASVWWATGDLRRATRTASTVGRGFGLALIVLGVAAIISGEMIGGLWWILIGLFIRSAAQGARLQMETARLFEGAPVRQFMTPDPIAAPPDISLRRFIDEFVYHHHQDRFPVARDGHALGTIGLDELKRTDRASWDQMTIADAMTALSPATLIGPSDDASGALKKMHQSGLNRLPVVEGDRLVGDVALQDLLALLNLTLQLEDPAPPQPI